MQTACVKFAQWTLFGHTVEPTELHAQLAALAPWGREGGWNGRIGKGGRIETRTRVGREGYGR